MANYEHLDETLVFKLDGVALIAATSFTFGANRDLIETTTKDSNGFKKFRPGLKEFSGSFDGAVVRDSGNSTDYEALLTNLALNDTSLGMIIDDSDASTNISMEGYLESVELSSSLGDKQTFTGAFKVSGGITIS